MKLTEYEIKENPNFAPEEKEICINVFSENEKDVMVFILIKKQQLDGQLKWLTKGKLN